MHVHRILGKRGNWVKNTTHLPSGNFTTEEPRAVRNVFLPATVEAQPRKNFGLKKLFLVSVAIGAGLGVGIVATVASVRWLTSRPIPTRVGIQSSGSPIPTWELSPLEIQSAGSPIPTREWPPLEIQSAGLRAKLKTDWDGHFVRYQLVVTPRRNELKSEFDRAVRSHRNLISFVVHLYDKAGFEVCKKWDVKPVAVVGARGRIEGLQASNSFYSYECSRSSYNDAIRWNLSYVFPTLTTNTFQAVPF